VTGQREGRHNGDRVSTFMQAAEGVRKYMSDMVQQRHEGRAMLREKHLQRARGYGSRQMAGIQAMQSRGRCMRKKSEQHGSRGGAADAPPVARPPYATEQVWER